MVAVGVSRTLAFRSPAVTLLAGMQASSAAIPPLQARMRLRYGGGQQWRPIALALQGARGLSVKVKTVSVAEKFYLQVFIGLLSEGVVTFFYN